MRATSARPEVRYKCACAASATTATPSTHLMLQVARQPSAPPACRKNFCDRSRLSRKAPGDRIHQKHASWTALEISEICGQSRSAIPPCCNPTSMSDRPLIVSANPRLGPSRSRKARACTNSSERMKPRVAPSSSRSNSCGPLSVRLTSTWKSRAAAASTATASSSFSDRLTRASHQIVKATARHAPTTPPTHPSNHPPMGHMATPAADQAQDRSMRTGSWRVRERDYCTDG